MNNLEKSGFIKYKYDAFHRFDTSENDPHDYSNDNITRNISKPLLSNPRNNEFILELQELTTLLIDYGYSVRNFWDMSVDQYYSKHSN